MADESTIPQDHYVSSNPEQDWENFQDTMRHIVSVPKPGATELSSQEQKKRGRSLTNQYE